MRRRSSWAVGVGIVLAFQGFAAIDTHAASPLEAWRGKVAPSVLAAAERGGATEFLVVFADQPDLSRAQALPSKAAKGRFVYRRLTEAANRSQAGLLAELHGKVEVLQPFWLVNAVHVRGDLKAVRAAAERGEVSRILPNPAVRFDGPDEVTAESAPPGAESVTAAEWGVTRVGAPPFWTAGFSGQGVVVAGQDTGYRWTHNAIKGKYRGWNGSSADHDYSWHDAITAATNAGTGGGGGGSCSLSSIQPCDDQGHGTHTMGTMVGDDGGANQVGVAPGAKWIGCRNMNVGVGSPSTYIDCFQFFVAPTRVNGTDADTTKAPHVINNSWGCDASEGCTDVTPLLRTAVENARNAGILVVVSAGNDGSACSTVQNPAAIYEASFSVGATDINDNIASFSSRGPVTFDGSGRLKPNVSAPGVTIRSSLRTSDSSYGNNSGTSMAGPHVAGLSALIMSRAPWLKGRPGALESHIENTSVFKASSACGSSASSRPNNTFGFGIVKAVPANQTVVDLDGDADSEAVLYSSGAWLYFPVP
jgi:serine protease AprX